jgi:SAM-dependent MidA family methyltransferase
MSDALYGPGGFYRRENPADHFRTSVAAAPPFADAIVELVSRVDQALGRPEQLDLVDVGAGDGALLQGVLHRLSDDVRHRLRGTGVEIRPAPLDLDPAITWTPVMPQEVVGLVVANEYLDNVPCDVVERYAGQLRHVLVNGSGDEQLGEPVAPPEHQWMQQWWKGLGEGDRAELGLSRDAAWASIVHSVSRGVAVAVDYGHTTAERETGRFAAGTLTGYCDGYQLPAVPDGTCDVTAHVAIDSCAAAGTAAGAEHSTLLRQRDVLRALGLSATPPPLALAHGAPDHYLYELSQSSAVAELTDPTSLGSFWWLLQSKSVRLPIETSALSD